MKENVTIRDVLPTLADPEGFLCGVLLNFGREGFSKTDALVKIGTSGVGRQPHYRIDEGAEEQSLQTVDGEPTTINLRMYRHSRAFHGRSHNIILEQEDRGIRWSSETATYADVQAILHEHRAHKRR